MELKEIFEMMAEAEASIAKVPIYQLGPNGLEIVEPKPPVVPPSGPKRWTGKPRRGSKQWRRENGVD